MTAIFVPMECGSKAAAFPRQSGGCAAALHIVVCGGRVTAPFIPMECGSKAAAFRPQSGGSAAALQIAVGGGRA